MLLYHAGDRNASEIMKYISHLSREEVIGLGIALGLSLPHLLKMSNKSPHEEMVQEWLSGTKIMLSWRSFARGLAKMKMMDIVDDIKKGF